MSTALEVTLIAVLLALAAGMLPLLIQLRRTARSLETFLEAARGDLGRIAEDVHAVQEQVTRLAADFGPPVASLARFAGALGRVGAAVEDLHARVRSTCATASRRWGGLTAGLSALLGFPARRPSTQEPFQEQRP